jgi:DNA-binding NarL/FixJ family response regulator
MCTETESVSSLLTGSFLKQNEKILIIDDDHLVRNIIKQITSQVLKKYNLNYEILEGEDGEDLIYYVKNDTDNLIRLIITDEHMEKVNGSDALNEIKKIGEKPFKAISITSVEDELSILRIMECGADEVYKKPVNKSVLEKVILRLLGVIYKGSS